MHSVAHSSLSQHLCCLYPHPFNDLLSCQLLLGGRKTAKSHLSLREERRTLSLYCFFQDLDQSISDRIRTGGTQGIDTSLQTFSPFRANCLFGKRERDFLEVKVTFGTSLSLEVYRSFSLSLLGGGGRCGASL